MCVRVFNNLKCISLKWMQQKTAEVSIVRLPHTPSDRHSDSSRPTKRPFIRKTSSVESPHYAPSPRCLSSHVQSILRQIGLSILFTALEIIRPAREEHGEVECRGCLKASSFSNPGTPAERPNSRSGVGSFAVITSSS